MSWAPLKRLCTDSGQYGLNVPADEYVSDGIRLLRTGDLVGGSVPDEGIFVSGPIDSRFRLQAGDLLLSRAGTIGRSYLVALEDEGSTFAGFLIRFRPNPDVDARYLAYSCQSQHFVDQVQSGAVESTIQNFNAERYANVRVHLPQPEEQRRIADYLDTETARIDVLIEKRLKVVALGHERSWVALEDGLAQRGVELPDKVGHRDIKGIALPEGWRAPKLSAVLTQLTNGYVGPTRDILVESGIRYVQGLHIKGGRIQFGRRPYFVDDSWHRQHRRTALGAGDVLLVQTGDIGQVAVVPPDFGEANCHALLIARTNPAMCSGDYLATYLRSRIGYHSLVRMATGALHPHLEFSIRDVPVILPPRSVQRELAAEVGATQEMITRYAEFQGRQVELLTERRSALITAVVTGGLDIPGVAA